MLDDESTTGTTENTGEARDPAAPRPRRRAASRPAGPPPVPSEESAPVVVAEPVAAKKSAAKKVAAKKTAAKKSVAEEPAAQHDTAEEPVAAKKSAAKRTTAKKTTARKSAAKAVDVDAVGTEDDEGAAVDLSPTVPLLFQAPEAPARTPRRRPAKVAEVVDEADKGEDSGEDEEADDSEEGAAGDGDAARRRRRRGGRRRRRGGSDSEGSTGADGESLDDSAEGAAEGAEAEGDEGDEGDDRSGSTRRRRRRRRGAGSDDDATTDDPPNTVTRVRAPRQDVTSVRGSTRLEAKKQRRRDGRDAGRRRAPILTEAEFLARREDVDRVMVVREKDGRTQIAVLEDGVLVEHYVDRGTSGSMVGNVYLGRVQNVLPSMEAAFVDIGRGRNAVLYAGEVNWDAAGLDGQPKRIEFALKSGDPVLVQVTKDPMGHKGARLTSQISLPGRYLVYVPGGGMTGISRKLPDTERSRLKRVLKEVVPADGGVIVRTAAEGASEAELQRDVSRLAAQWEDIEAKSKTAPAATLLYGEPDLAIRVVRDIFNEDFAKLVVTAGDAWDTLESYVGYVAPDLAERLEKWVGNEDAFAHYRVEEQLTKAFDRKVWLPSGGSLVIDRTEAMTVVDVNTGKFTGQGGNLEETVTRNNLEAAEEVVRQLRLRDIGGIIVIDFIDMVLESNRDAVVRRLVECLGRDRTKHQVAEITSLGLVQMTRKRIGQGLLETFSEPCEHCNGRGVRVQLEPVPSSNEGEGPGRGSKGTSERSPGRARGGAGGSGGSSGSSTPSRRSRGRGKGADETVDAEAGSDQPGGESAPEPAPAEPSGEAV